MSRLSIGQDLGAHRINKVPDLVHTKKEAEEARVEVRYHDDSGFFWSLKGYLLRKGTVHICTFPVFRSFVGVRSFALCLSVSWGMQLATPRTLFYQI